jgi:hypothetical protein
MDVTYQVFNMKRLLFLFFVLLCSLSYGQTYQSMPQAGYGPVKRMLFDSVVTIPIGITSLRNITGGKDTAQIRYNKSDSSIYVYSGTQWIKAGGTTIDTTGAFLSAVSQPNDSSLTFVKGTTATTYTIKAVGSAKRLITTVYNNTGATILKGSVVYISGRHSSNLATIALAQANNEANSYKTFAIADQDIADNSSGIIIQAGSIVGLNLPTSSYTDGDVLYLSPTVAGGYTTTKPLAPYHICKLGSVTRAHPTLGSIEIKIENGWQLDELSDVQIAAVPSDSVLLQFSRTDSLWHDVSINSALGGRFNAKQDTSTSWKTGGNFNVNASQFIGSRNNASLRFRTNNTETMILDSIGRLQFGSATNNATVNNFLQFKNTNNRSFFNINTNSSISQISLKANNDAVADSMIINDSGLIQTRTNSTLWLRGGTTGGLQIVANRCGSCGPGNIFSASFGSNAPVFNISSTGATSIGAASAATSSLVDMSSTSLGLLIPRMTTTQRNAISSPASQLIVANTTNKTLDQYNGTSWNAIAGDYNGQLQMINLMGGDIIGAPFHPISMTTSSTGLSNTVLNMVAVVVQKETIATGVQWFQGTQGVYTANNTNGVALYSVDPTTFVITKIAESTNDGNIWKGTTGTVQTKDFATPVTIQPGLYYIGALYNSSAQTTAPVVWGTAVGGLVNNSRGLNVNPYSIKNGQNTFPATYSGGSFANYYYTFLLY